LWRSSVSGVRNVEVDRRFVCIIFPERNGGDVSQSCRNLRPPPRLVVVVKNGQERDAFDDANPLYLVSVDPDTEEYWGSLRLLPTTGPNMVRDVFPQLLDGGYIESATIWESSRICASAAAGQPERSRSGVNYVLSELILGIGEVAVAAGLTQIVSVFDARIFRVLKTAGCNPQIIGTPQRIGDIMCYAGLFDTGEGPLRAFRAATGIDHSVLAPGAKEMAFA
jgi:acyl homoserine lactone synthase